MEACAWLRLWQQKPEGAWQNLGKVTEIIFEMISNTNAEQVGLLFQVGPSHRRCHFDTGQCQNVLEEKGRTSKLSKRVQWIDLYEHCLGWHAAISSGICRSAQGWRLLHFWPQQFLSSINWDKGIPVIHTQQCNVCTNVFTEVSALLFHLLFVIWYLSFFITSCVIFLQHRQRNSHLFSLAFSRHFFVCSWLCCFSLGLFSFLLLLGCVCLFICLN